MTEPRFERIQTNGITLEVAIEGEGPLCVLLHGWPELWLSWRHQIAPLVAAGYRVAVPDVRGYGGSEAPGPVQAYAMTTMTADVVGLIEALGERRAILIGHDWGAPIAWHTAVLHPNHVDAVVGMSVPYLGRGGPAPPTTVLRAMYKERFFYILYFQRPEVPEAEFEADVRSALAKIYFANSADVTAEVRAAMRARTRQSGYLDGLVVPDPLPAWLTTDDLDRYVAAYERSGFRGGLQRYRNMDADWHALPQLDRLKIRAPALFVAGQYDSVLRYVPGMNLMSGMDPFFEDLRGKVVIPGAGHWVQQERPHEVNQVLLEFLGSVAKG
ncbi:MAG: alpha/beta hydrolase [Myxococcota bacterium]